ncbi:MAG: DUF3459 domain-containing protein [Chloroflexi bacterium]|nr:DUF3459 domain-containing protein [Chloroflexota bacterium]
MHPDRIFGRLIDPDQRVVQHRENLSGVKHLHQLEPLDPQPDQPITLTLTTGGPLAFDAARCFYTTDDRDPAGVSALSLDLQDQGAVWDTVEWGYARRWIGVLPPQPARTMVRYHLAARVASSGWWVFADNQAARAAEATDFAVWVDDDPAPAWAREAVVYHVFLDRFYPGDGQPWLQPASLSGFFGGTLRGVIQKLDYIQSLGFNAIWLSPLFPTPSHHGYDATDLYTVEPRLGTRADLAELIDAAHARGIRVIFDFVANHWSSAHPTFRDAQSNPHSPYRDWYIWKRWPDEYEAYFNVKELPQLNLQPGAARDYLLEAARYWLQQGVDGYRLDFAYGPPHDFWSDFRRACRSVRPDCWIFGEVVHTAEAQRSYGGRMDGTLDFLLCRALRETFAFETWNLMELEAFLCGHEAYFPPGFSRPSFIDNRDMNRFLFAAGDDRARLKLGALTLFTLGEPPIVYNGTEVGVTQERPIHEGTRGVFEEARLPMKWGDEQDAELLAYFRRLVDLRRAHPVLRHGARRVVHLDAEAGTYAYVREDGAACALVVFNRGDVTRTLTLPFNGLPVDARDRLNDSTVEARGAVVTVHLNAHSGALIV